MLTGEGADEALAGYAWFKTQKIRDVLRRKFGNTVPSAIRGVVLGMMGGDRSHLPERFPMQGFRTAQQDIYDLLGQAARSFTLADVKVAAMPFFKGCRWIVWHYKNKANLGGDWGGPMRALSIFAKAKISRSTLTMCEFPMARTR